MRKISDRALFAYGAHSADYRLFALGSLSNYPPEKLVHATTHLCTTATAHLTTLSAEGLTAAIITATSALGTQLDAVLAERFTLGITRESATIRRTELGNRLYALLTTLSEKGKLCWYGINPTKYNHYLLTE